MTNLLNAFETAGILFTILTGSLIHSAYPKSGYRILAGILAPANESVWEHLKLLFTPMVIYSIVEFLLIGWRFPNFITAKVAGLVTGLVLIPIFFYICHLFIKQNALFIDILIFIVCVVIAFLVSRALMLYTDFSHNLLSIIILLLLAAVFVLFSFNPPRIGLFQDSPSKTYGLGRMR